MNMISAVIVLLVLVQQQASACEVHITSVEIDCKNDEYIGEATASVTEEGNNAIYNAKTVIVKNIPEDVQCAMEVYNKGDNGEWQLIPHEFPKGPCCKIINEHKYFEKIKEHHMVKDNCPAKEGTYDMENISFERKCDDKAPKGDYKVQFKSNTADGKCLYTSNSYVTIA